MPRPAFLPLRGLKPTRAGVRKKVHALGRTFDSQAEYEHALVLLDRQRRGEIHDLTMQHSYPLVVNGDLICTWSVDFRYVEYGKGVVVEDVKSPMTRRLPEYRIKKKLFEALHPGTTVNEVVSSRSRRRPR